MPRQKHYKDCEECEGTGYDKRYDEPCMTCQDRYEEEKAEYQFERQKAIRKGEW
jgi:DnaJ-class molecular chaperone